MQLRGRRRPLTRVGLATALSGIALCSLALAGCSDGSGVSGLSTNPYVTLQLNVRSAVMSTVAPYNTLQLTATPYLASGAVANDSIVATFKTKDTTLSITPDGLVTAHTKTPSTWIAVSLRDPARNITHIDTLFVTVTDQVPTSPMVTFSIHRPPGDSAKVAIYDAAVGLFQDTVRVAASAEDGTDLQPVLRVRYLVSDSAIATINPASGVVTGMRPGEVVIWATTTYYGVTKTDSMRMTIGNPVSATVYSEIRPSATVAGEYVRVFNPSTITIGVGGTILFSQAIRLDGPDIGTDVVFDDPSAAQPSTLPVSWLDTGTGNIGPLPSLTLNGAFNPDCFVSFSYCAGATRSFPVAGTYHYHSALYGTSGTIVVAAP
jgi:hypothetical protein